MDEFIHNAWPLAAAIGLAVGFYTLYRIFEKPQQPPGPDYGDNQNWHD